MTFIHVDRADDVVILPAFDAAYIRQRAADVC